MNRHIPGYSPISGRIASWTVFVVSLCLYWLTADPGVSYWDCPEYVTAASRLEIGHPPGNPIWMLVMRMATIPFPVDLHAYVINLCSGLFMAGAAFFLSRIIFAIIIWTCPRLRHSFAALASAGGALCFALCDSAWFSAVEAEVYAMSAFLSALTIWLMLRWAATENQGKRDRLLILTAYVMGLSLGVHQLNLLCIPVLALIYYFRKNPRGDRRFAPWGMLLLSFAAVALILMGMMHGTLRLAMWFELLAVNSLRLPYSTGVLIYVFLLAACSLAAIVSTSRHRKKESVIALTLFMWLSGIFVFTESILIPLIISAVAAIAAVSFRICSPRKLATATWMLTFILLGYSSFALIIIRANASPPMNEAAPTDIFALASYISRDQYGSKPLLYGATPYSRPMVEERFKGDSPFPDYSRYVIEKGKERRHPFLPSPRVSPKSGLLSRGDSIVNQEIMERNHGYLLSDYSFKRVTTPELDMFFPRITGGSPSDLEGYASWAGMERGDMKRVAVSETFDSLGNPVPKISLEGERRQTYSYRPTYLQNLRYFITYQVGYMYLRYLMWNFIGRQNDIPATGEIDHGNFITGIDTLDRLMLGDTDLMPPGASSENPGRNIYFGIPFLLGVAGIFFLLSRGRRGRRSLALISLLFLMTGIAIVIYLNQTPGEPRERDYSFLASYMAFSIWIGFGMAAIPLWLSRFIRNNKLISTIAAIISLGTPAFMGAVNLDDHDRRGRDETYIFASNLLLTPRPSIIFSQGDNFTFPLWYAVEVMKTGPRHTVIDVNYFNMPDYVTNLLRQGDNAIPLTAGESDIAFGAYSHTRIASDADTVPVDAVTALKELYSQDDATPVIRHRFWNFNFRGHDKPVTVDIRQYAGSHMLPFRKLMLLDLIATNSASPDPRPVYFLSSIYDDIAHPFRNSTIRLPYADVLYPSMPSGDHKGHHISGSIYHKLLSEAVAIPLSREKSSIRYTDPVIADQRRRQRGELVIASGNLISLGDTSRGLAVLEGALRLHPFAEVSPASFTLADTTFHEGMECASLMWRLANETSDSLLNDDARISLKERTRGLVEMMWKESRQWQIYYSSLPEWRRNAVSNSSRRLISVIPRLKRLKEMTDNPPDTPSLQGRNNN